MYRKLFWKDCRGDSLRPARAGRKIRLRQHWITKQMWIPKRVEADSDLCQKEKCFIAMLFTLQFGSGAWQQRRMTENCRQNTSRQQRGTRDRKNWWTAGSQLCRADEIHSRVLKGLQCHRMWSCTCIEIHTGLKAIPKNQKRCCKIFYPPDVCRLCFFSVWKLSFCFWISSFLLSTLVSVPTAPGDTKAGTVGCTAKIDGKK